MVNAAGMTREEALFEAERAGEPVTHVRAHVEAVRLERIRRELRTALERSRFHRQVFGYGVIEVRQHIPTGVILGVSAVRP